MVTKHYSIPAGVAKTITPKTKLSFNEWISYVYGLKKKDEPKYYHEDEILTMFHRNTCGAR